MSNYRELTVTVACSVGVDYFTDGRLTEIISDEIAKFVTSESFRAGDGSCGERVYKLDLGDAQSAFVSINSMHNNVLCLENQ